MKRLISQNQNLESMREKLCCFVKDNSYTKGLVIGESFFYILSVSTAYDNLGRLPFTSSMGVEILGVNIQC